MSSVEFFALPPPPPPVGSMICCNAEYGARIWSSATIERITPIGVVPRGERCLVLSHGEAEGNPWRVRVLTGSGILGWIIVTTLEVLS